MSNAPLFARTVNRAFVARITFAAWLALLFATAESKAQLVNSLQSDEREKDRLAAKREFIESTEIVFSPAPLPSPALKHQLLPPLEKLKERNAAPMYTRAILLQHNLGGDHFKTYVEKSDEWLKWPMSDQSRAEAARWVSDAAAVYDEVRLGALSAHCDWDVRLHEKDGAEILLMRLTEFQESRSLARLLAVKARVEIAEGRLDEALETLQVGFKLGHDVGEAPLTICNLIGMAISQMMCQETEIFCQAEGAPNLYWAVADVPQPFVDVRPGLQIERMIPRKLFPFLTDAETVKRTPEEWRAALQGALDRIDEVTAGGLQVGKDLDKILQEGYPKAKQGLLDFGMKQDEVAAMSPAEAVGVYTARLVNYVYDETFKWNSIYPEARETWKKSIEEMVKAGFLSADESSGVESREVLPICSTLIPTTQGVHWAGARCQRRFETLRVLEAIRSYAAAHDGQLPSSLDEIDTAPAPKNNFTGRPFFYERQGDTAVLIADAPAGFAPAAFSRKYTISVRK